MKIFVANELLLVRYLYLFVLLMRFRLELIEGKEMKIGKRKNRKKKNEETKC